MEKRTMIIIGSILGLTVVISGAILFFGGLTAFNHDNPNDESSKNGSSHSGNNSAANLIMTDWQGSGDSNPSDGHYATINFVVKNEGNGTATFGSVRLYSTDQNGEIEANTLRTLPAGLSSGKTYELSFTVKLETEDTLLNNKITISWTGGFNEYSKVINL